MRKKKKKRKHNLFRSNILFFSRAKLIPYSYPAYLIRPFIVVSEHKWGITAISVPLKKWVSILKNDIFLSSSADICQSGTNEKNGEIKNVISIAQGLN